MQFKVRLGAFVAASLFVLQANAVLIPTDLDISGSIETDSALGFDGAGSMSILMEAIDNGASTSTTTVSGDLSAPNTAGSDPLSVARFENTDAGFSFDGSFSPDSGTTPIEVHEYAGKFDFDIDNQTIHDYGLTWTFVFNLGANAKGSLELMQSYLQSDVFGALFRRDLQSDGTYGDLVTIDTTDIFPPTYADVLSEAGSVSFTNTVAAGTQSSFGGSFGIYAETFDSGSLLDAHVNFDVLLTSVENLTNNNPPPTTVPEPSALVLILMSLGFLQLCRRK